MKRSDNKFTNSLIKETSPYLLQHAHNPVNWQAWNPEVLAMARNLDRPVIVSIGYSACHWCHVMERESFEDEEVAQLMNEHFICIKVDREERPDVDQMYMTAINLITGSGGWPLNCFALPDGRPFHGGTYFRRDDWLRVLNAVKEEFEQNRSKLDYYATQLKQGIADSQLISAGEKKADYSSELEKMVTKWQEQFDPAYGGENRQPKFPLPDNYLFLLRYATTYNDSKLLDHVNLSLQMMSGGGLFDHVEGGFARYSTDRMWKVPHFEKMLYDNALLLKLYSVAEFQSDQSYLGVIYKTVDFLLNRFRTEEGFFISSMDADSEGSEGSYYTWTMEELEKIIPDSLRDFARLHYVFDHRAEWEERYILIRNLDVDAVSEELGLDSGEYERMINQLDEVLRLGRKELRKSPDADVKALTSWNAMAVTGLCWAYLSTKRKDAIDAARQVLEMIRTRLMNDDGSLWHSYKDGRSTIQGFIEDYAFLIEAMLEFNRCTADQAWLTHANDLAKHAVRKFFDASAGMFRFAETDNSELQVNPIEYLDSVTPSSNAVMARNLRKLYLLTDHSEYERIYQSMLEKVAPRIASYGSGYSHWAQTLLDEAGPSFEVVVSGKNASAMALELGGNYLPQASVFCSNTDSEHNLFRNRFDPDKTMIYVCRDRVCQLPVDSVEEAVKMMV